MFKSLKKTIKKALKNPKVALSLKVGGGFFLFLVFGLAANRYFSQKKGENRGLGEVLVGSVRDVGGGAVNAVDSTLQALNIKEIPIEPAPKRSWNPVECWRQGDYIRLSVHATLYTIIFYVNYAAFSRRIEDATVLPSVHGTDGIVAKFLRENEGFSVLNDGRPDNGGLFAFQNNENGSIIDNNSRPLEPNKEGTGVLMLNGSFVEKGKNKPETNGDDEF